MFSDGQLFCEEGLQGGLGLLCIGLVEECVGQSEEQFLQVLCFVFEQLQNMGEIVSNIGSGSCLGG